MVLVGQRHPKIAAGASFIFPGIGVQAVRERAALIGVTKGIADALAYRAFWTDTIVFVLSAHLT
jgi:hypothetical protein